MYLRVADLVSSLSQQQQHAWSKALKCAREVIISTAYSVHGVNLYNILAELIVCILK